MFDIDVDQRFFRVLYKYCPRGYGIRVEEIGGVVDWSNHFCTCGVVTPDRDQEGSCMAAGKQGGAAPVYPGTGSKLRQETDCLDGRDPRFALVRYYNSMSSIYRGAPAATRRRR